MRIFTICLFLTAFCPLLTNAQTYPMDGSPITDCSGFFSDSGGGNSDYGPNEDLTTTICSDNSTGTHIQLVFSGVTLGAGDLLCFYDGTDVSATQLSCSDDFTPGAPFIIQATAANTSGCLTVTFTSDATDETAGWSADINCIAACQTILANLTSTDPVVEPVDTGYIDICPGDRVYLNAAGSYPQDGVIYNHSDLTSSFTWDFGDGNMAVGPNTSHVYQEPGGYIVQLTIEDQFGCKNTNFISQRVRVSTYPDFELAGDIPEQVCAGDTLSLHALVANLDSTYEVSVTPTEGSFQTQGVRSDSLPLPDGTGATYQTSIAFADFSPGQVLTNISDLIGICVNMEHSWMHDLEITLSCPNGTTVVLQDQVFQGEVFLGEPNEADEGMDPPLQGVGYDYCWTPDATTGNWTQYWQNTGVQTLPPGDYNAFETLDNFLGCPLNGEWTLTVQDLWGIDNGWIFEWSIGFDPSLYPNVETFTPEIVDFAWDNNPSIVFYEPDSIVAVLENAGSPSYTFSVTDDFGCSNDTTVVVNVLPPTHPDCYECNENLTPLQDTSLCVGDAASLDGEPSTPLEEQQITFESFIGVEFDNDIYPPGNPFNSVLDINSINPLTLTDANSQIASVCVNIEHTFNADIELRLIAPNGAVIELSTDNGGGGDGYLGTCFTPTATIPINSGTSPFTGDFLPEGNWADFNGSPINGAWTLAVADDQNGFGGNIVDWSITFNNENELTYFWTPSTGLSCTNCPDPVASPDVTTVYTLNAVDAFGCTDTETLEVTVLNALAAPVLACGPQDSGNLTVEWGSVPGASSYEVSLDGGATWIPSNGLLSHTVSGLVNGDIVDILVRAVSVTLNCPAEEANIQCTYLACSMTIDTTSTVSPSCWNTTDGLVFLSATSAQSPVTYALDGGLPQGPNISDVSAGFHYVIAVDAIGCTDSIAFTINAPDSIILQTTVDSVNCNGDCDGSAVALATGGNGGITYVWNTVPAIFDNTASNLCIGGYTVVATDVNGCSASETVDVFEPEVLSAVVTPSPASCFGAVDGAATALPSGGVAPYTIQWDNGEMGDNAVSYEAGPHSVIITDANGCVITQLFDITEPPVLALTLDATDVSCNGGMNGQVVAAVVGGNGGYTYNWDNGGGNGPIVSSVIAQTYCVTVTDVNNCTISDCITVNEPSAINLVTSATATLCSDSNDGTANVIASGGAGGYTYLWDNNDITPDADLLTPGMHFVTVTDANGCSEIAQVMVPQAPAIDLQISSTQTSCSTTLDGTASVIASGGAGNFTFLWDDPGTQSTSIIAGLATGQYCVVATDANGCTATACIDVTTPAPLEVTAVSPSEASCFGFNDGSVMVMTSGGTGPGSYSYMWNDDNNQFTNPAVSLTAGNYEVTVTDGNGCTVVATAVIAQPDTLTAITTFTEVSCFNGADGTATVVPSGGTMPYTYSWNDVDNQDTQTAMDLIAGNVMVTVTDLNGCTATAQASIDQPATAVSAQVSQTFVGCFDSGTGAAEVIPAGGVGNYTYEWSNGDLTSVTSSLDAITYEVTVTDANDCEFTTALQIDELPPIQAAVVTEDPTCFGDSDGTAEVITVNGGIGTGQINDYDYNWSGGQANNNAVSGLLAEFVYTVIITDAQGCTGTNTVTLDQPAELQASTATEAVSCFGGTDGAATVVDVQGENGNYTYQWDNAANNQITAEAIDLNAGVYTVLITDGEGCTTTTSVEVTQPTAIQADFAIENNLCSGNGEGRISTQVTGGTPGYTFAWDTGAEEADLSELVSGQYEVTITDANDCILIEQAVVGGPPPLSATLTVTDVTCFGDRDGRVEVMLEGGTPPYRYSLNGEEYNGSSVQVGLIAGNYTLYVLDNEDCDWSTSFEVDTPPAIEVDAGPEEVTIELGDSIRLGPSSTNTVGSVQYSWSAPYEGTLFCQANDFDCSDPWAIPSNTITYELYGIDENGCEGTDEIIVRVNKDRRVLVPTGFTPNDDGTNDLLLVHGKEGTVVNLFRIYDRWGNLVFETGDFLVNDETVGWDGTFRGKEMNPGVYVWYVEAEYIDGFTETFKGNTTLLR